MKTLYAFWTGDNPIPDIRKRSIGTMSSSGLEVKLVSSENLFDYISPERLHPAYQYLNLAHRADYLRAYFMHHFGGGYADVKPIHHPWTEAIEALERNDDYWALGYREVSRHGVGNLYQSSVQLRDSIPVKVGSYFKWRWLQVNYQRIIGNGAFVFKPDTLLTQCWWDEVNRRLDLLQGDLEKYPASHPKERGGHVYDGKVSRYPVPWSYILADVLQPLALKHSSRVLRDLPPPDFSNYQ